MVDAVRSGEADMVGQAVQVNDLRPEDYRNNDLEITNTRDDSFGQLTFNTQRFPTSVRVLRQSFAFSVDKVEIVQRAFSGAAYVTDTPISASLGYWSCEYEYCSPSYDTYYDHRPDLGNQTILGSGFYDFDNDGWREFFNGTIEKNGEIFWNGTAIMDEMNLKYDNNSNWDGYSWNTTNFNYGNIKFDQLNSILDANKNELIGSYTGIEYLADELKNSDDWIEVEFPVIGPSNSEELEEVLLIIKEAFEAIGIQTVVQYDNITAINEKMRNGNFFACLFDYEDVKSELSMLELFYSESEMNQERSRWYNATFDGLWNNISTSQEFEELYESGSIAQQILWQEQPISPLYNREIISFYRIDKFAGHSLILGKGAFTAQSLTQIYLKPIPENLVEYSNYPVAGNFTCTISQPDLMPTSLTRVDKTSLVVINLVEEMIFKRNQNSGELGSNIVKSWDIFKNCNSSDCTEKGLNNGTKVILHINSNAKWQINNSKVTSDDLKYSYDILGENESYTINERIKNAYIVSTEVIDSETLALYCNKSSFNILELINTYIYQKSYWETISNPADLKFDQITGPGPYKYKSHSLGEFYTLNRNPDYYNAFITNDNQITIISSETNHNQVIITITDIITENNSAELETKTPIRSLSFFETVLLFVFSFSATDRKSVV